MIFDKDDIIMSKVSTKNQAKNPNIKYLKYYTSFTPNNRTCLKHVTFSIGKQREITGAKLEG
jgi:hypothetical protein